MDRMGDWQVGSRLAPNGQPYDPVGGLLYEQAKHGSDVCDVSLLFAGIEQKVHKCVLMTSQYFHALYESGLLDNDKDKVTINVGSASAIQAAVKFLYLRQVDVSLQNVEELMEVADYLQISQMKEQCLDFLTRLNVGPENCVTLCLIGGQYNHDKLYQTGYEYLIAHLPVVLQHDEALCLGVDSVLDILKDNTLLYVSAEDLFTFLTRWVELDLDKRLPHLSELFNSLDLERFTEEGFYKLVSCHVLVNMFPPCQDRVSKFIMKLEAGNARLSGKEKQVFIMGGHEAEPHVLLTDRGRNMEAIGTRRFLCFLSWEKRWSELPPIPIKSTSRALITALSTKIYSTESRPLTYTEYQQQIYKYDTLQEHWSEIRAVIPYYEKCKSFQVLSLEQCRGRIYSVTTALSSVSHGQALHLYLLEEGQSSEMIWKKELLPGGLDIHNSKVEVRIVGDRYICITVRTDSQTDQELMFLVYDFETDEVENHSKGSLSLRMMFVKDGKVVVAEPGAGYAKVFSLDTKTWRVEHRMGIPDLPESVNRSEYSYFCDDEKLYLFGGKVSETKTYMRSSLMYDFKGKNWESLGFSPCRIVNTWSHVMKLSSEAVRCHIDCPHCKFTGLKQKAEYDILPEIVPDQTRQDEIEDGWESEPEDNSDDDNERLDITRVDVQNAF